MPGREAFYGPGGMTGPGGTRDGGGTLQVTCGVKVAPPVMPCRMMPVDGLEHTSCNAVRVRPTEAICPCGMVEYQPGQAKLASSWITSVMYLELKPTPMPLGMLRSKKIGVSPSSRPRKPELTGSSLPHRLE